MAVQVYAGVTPIDSGVVENACQHLSTLSQYILKEKDCEDVSANGIHDVVNALTELDKERLKLHDALEAETIKASGLRYKLTNVPKSTEKEIKKFIDDVRQSNLNELQSVQDQIKENQLDIERLKQEYEDLKKHDEELDPIKEKISFTHDDMVSDLNFLLNDKAQVQIELNDTWDEVRSTKKKIGKTEDSILKLHDDLIRERESARIARKELRNEILDTKKLKEAQLEENEGTSRIIDQLNTELNGIKEKNREKNMEISSLTRKIERWKGIYEQLMKSEKESLSIHAKECREGKEIGSVFSTMLKEYNAKREDQEAQLEKIHRELGEATQNAAKLEKERNQLHNTLKGAKTAAGRTAASLRLLNESLKNSKQELYDQSEETARLKRENAELEFRIQQADEGHKLNKELLTGQIDEVKESLEYEQGQKKIVQTERETLRKNEIAWKKDYQFNMNQLTIRIHALKQQNTQLLNNISDLKNDIETGDVDLVELRKKDQLEQEEADIVIEDLNSEIMELDSSIINTQLDLVKQQDKYEEMKPIFSELEKIYSEKQQYYEEEKKLTVERKGDKQVLEDKITKLKRDIKRLQMPREKLHGQIKDSRFQSLNQIREQARETLETEQNIKLMGEKKHYLNSENDKIKESTELLDKDVKDIEEKTLIAEEINQKMATKLIALKRELISSYKKDLEMDGMYARVDLGVLSDITEMHQTTERRQEKIAEIQSQLEKQIRNMEKFIFDVSSASPPPSCVNIDKPLELPPLKPPFTGQTQMTYQTCLTGDC